ncbi:hypothetical protein K438DRAFT_1753979 [Mycena galopus ATCC 62051]|nr:hypothetical protein K438DRAFT_1753979 [Mycena galopus ATCC 62051]
MTFPPEKHLWICGIVTTQITTPAPKKLLDQELRDNFIAQYVVCVEYEILEDADQREIYRRLPGVLTPFRAGNQKGARGRSRVFMIPWPMAERCAFEFIQKANSRCPRLGKRW